MKATLEKRDQVRAPSLDGDLRRLQTAVNRLCRTCQDAQISELVSEISTSFEQRSNQHALEVAQLQDELRILHEMLNGKYPKDRNEWRSQLQRRSAFETKIRIALTGGQSSTIVCVPIPSPLVAGEGSVGLERFLEDLSPRPEDFSAVWTSKLAVVWRSDPLPVGSSQRLLPEMVKIGDLNYVVRSRSWEVVSKSGEDPDAFLKRLGEAQRNSDLGSSHAS